MSVFQSIGAKPFPAKLTLEFFLVLGRMLLHVMFSEAVDVAKRNVLSHTLFLDTKKPAVLFSHRHIDLRDFTIFSLTSVGLIVVRVVGLVTGAKMSSQR